MISFSKLLRSHSDILQGRCFNLILGNQARSYSKSCPNILITGGLGQLGTGLARQLRRKYGRNNVILSDIVKPSPGLMKDGSSNRPYYMELYACTLTGPFVYTDILDNHTLNEVIVTHQIDWLIHFSALLSAVGEQNVQLAIKVNIEGMHNILEAAKNHNLRLFIPSTIGVFGPDAPKNPTPNNTIMRPRTIYGVSKVHCELMGEYYSHKFKLDFRSLRLPGIISYDTVPGGGTTDYAVEIFHDAVSHREHKCYLKPDTRLPMMYIDDCLMAIQQFMEIDPLHLKQRVYNINAMSFTPSEIFSEIKKLSPDFAISFHPDERQAIADGWPDSLDDADAKRDWGWHPQYNLPKMCSTMFEALTHRHLADVAS